MICGNKSLYGIWFFFSYRFTTVDNIFIIIERTSVGIYGQKERESEGFFVLHEFFTKKNIHFNRI